MSDNSPITAKRRLDYKPSDFDIVSIDLSFNLDDDKTRVKSLMHVVKRGGHQRPLILNGEQLTLIDVKLAGKSLERYELTEDKLILSNLPEACFIEIYTEIDPAANTSLEGLYKTSGSYCTQCEAEGFRKITYFLDRPDVLSTYTVSIYADKSAYPYLLSNGNKIDSGELEDGKHWVKWHDPHKKPSYLFALVAGDFDLLEDQYTTSEGRQVALELYVDKGKLGRGQHAIDSLKKAISWDEKVFGLAYDLDVYMIVAVDFFNMGAMENKGLNVFNSKFVLADNESATDEDFFNIESVIAHEYFHNWTGNRVTCRDWFQLSLKEGLTVFRDQQFSADMSSADVNRIKNVKVVREHQFAEDSSSMAHPIRPDEVIEMNNFYTVTVYDKGAEVIRMLHTILGQEGFRKGMDLYFERHDGQAVTCDDFVNAMQGANNVDLEHFKLWYSQSGTPELKIESEYDIDDQTLRLSIKQSTPPTLDQQQKNALHIPVSVEFLSHKNNRVVSQSEVVNITKNEQVLTKNDISAGTTVAVLGGFSAPVKVFFQQKVSELIEIALHSQDGFSRWDAVQRIFSQYIHSQTESKTEIEVEFEDIKKLIDGLFELKQTDLALLAEMLTIPSIETLIQQVPKYYVESLHTAREGLIKQIAVTYEAQFIAQYNALGIEGYRYEQSQVNNRRFKNQLLQFIALSKSGAKYIHDQYSNADNMTDTLGALKAASLADLSIFDDLMNQFEQKWVHDSLVLDKWFSLYATKENPNILSRLDLLMGHQQFNHQNPNRVRALIGSFAFYNAKGFHAADGSGYRYLTNYLLKLDSINAQVAARIVTPLTQWQKLDSDRVTMMKHELARLLDHPTLSKDVYEKVSKSLAYQ